MTKNLVELNFLKQIRKVHSFLILWIVCFLIGLVLTSMNIILLFLVSLADATILFLPLLFLWWLFHHRVAGIVLAVFILLVFAIFVYQNPSSFTKSSFANEAFLSEGSVMSSIADKATSPPSGAPVPVNTPSSPYAVLSIYTSYKANEAEAATEYTGKFAYVSGVVADVELVSNTYESCVNLVSSSGMNLVYGCGPTTYAGDFVYWYWASQSAATQVPEYSSFVGECTITGLNSNGTLVLSGCSIAP